MSIPNVVQATKARSTGTLILVIDNRDRSYMDDDQRWYTVCDDHGSLVGHRTRSLATNWAPEPESWCDECRARLQD